jgi:hypothetical protein
MTKNHHKSAFINQDTHSNIQHALQKIVYYEHIINILTALKKRAPTTSLKKRIKFYIPKKV